MVATIGMYPIYFISTEKILKLSDPSLKEYVGEGGILKPFITKVVILVKLNLRSQKLGTQTYYHKNYNYI